MFRCEQRTRALEAAVVMAAGISGILLGLRG